MYFLWVRCENRGKGYYLPQTESWSGRLTIDRDISHTEDNLFLQVIATDGVYTLEAPRGFVHCGHAAGTPLAHCSHFAFTSRTTRLDVYVAQVDKQSTVMQKLVFSSNPVAIGAKPENTIQYQQPSVSRKHALLTRQRNGQCRFIEQSKNGSYVNGEFCCGETRTLHFGDTIVILPALQLCYLGDCLCVNRAADVIISPEANHFAIPAVKSEAIPPPRHFANTTAHHAT